MTILPRIALDAMGGDHAPDTPLRGALDAARDLPVNVSVVGPEDRVRDALQRLAGRDAHASELPRIVDAPELIAMAEHPVTAVRSKRRSSIVVGVKLVGDGEADAFVTAGNTG